ncbi:MAG: oligosaccharide flippase family protein [Tannerellaceae bacterium]|jgi:PST family polysaccharide transporter|nr:oligosaccharide flippase family protein [Tannerellaceae bacterium]
MLSISELMKKSMTQNFVSLVLLQGMNFLLPLLTLPYLYRVLGTERYGLVSFAYTLAQYLVMLTDFGFNLSATKYISMHRDNMEVVNQYLNSAFICRFLLAGLSFLILFSLTVLFDRFERDAWFYISYFGIVIGNVMFPMWYFQGMEKMKYITIFNVIAKTVSLVSFFIFIRRATDYVLVPLFYSAGFILAGFISIYIIYVKEKMRWFIPALKQIRFVFSDSLTYFMSRISVSMFTHINTFVIGLVCGNTAVGYYAAAEKLYQAYNLLLAPFSGVLFPYMAKTRDVPFFKRVLKYITPANVILLIATLLCSSWIIYIMYGESSQTGSLWVFRILMCGCVLTIPSMLLGYPFLAAMGHARYTNWTLVLVSIFHLTGLTVLYFLGFISIYSIAGLVVLSESLLFIIRVRGVKKYKLLS